MTVMAAQTVLDARQLGRRGGLLAVAIVGAIAVASCGAAAIGPGGSDSTAAATTGGSVPPATLAAPAATRVENPARAASPTSGPVVATGRGWDSGGLFGPVPAPGSCHYRLAASGYYLPDPACTPGAIDPGVTQADLAATICRSGGYTSSVRPPAPMTGDFKTVSRAAYRDPAPSTQTELDHLVPLGVGGASDTRNLWPEPDQGSPQQFDHSDGFGSNAKDGVESKLHDAVCSGRVTLVAAQLAITADWTTAEQVLGLQP